MKFWILTLASAALIAGQAVAQSQPKTFEELSNQLKQQEAEARTKPGRGFLATTVAPINLSLTDLLNAGWTITGGAWGVGLTIHKDTKWAVCEVDDGKMVGNLPGSRCVALN